MRSPLACAVLLALSIPVLFAQEGSAPPAAPPKPTEPAVTTKRAENLNGLLVDARKATAEKRFADSEALMLPITQNNPNLILPWVELGLAQLGLKKYDAAETAFKNALGIDPASLRRAHGDDFYQSPDAPPGTVAPTATRASRNAQGGTVNSGENRTIDVQGVCWASLGEIYAHEKKFPEATAAFDKAVTAFPASTAQYRHNETIAFFQAGNTEGQLLSANQAIAIDTARADNYYFKGQALVSKATLDPQTQKMVLPPGCAEAYQRYLELDPNGPYSADAKSVLTAAGLPLKSGKR